MRRRENHQSLDLSVDALNNFLLHFSLFETVFCVSNFDVLPSVQRQKDGMSKRYKREAQTKKDASRVNHRIFRPL